MFSTLTFGNIYFTRHLQKIKIVILILQKID
jgi:hypothetical protein